MNGRNFVSLTRTIPGVLRGIPGANIDGAGSLAWRASAAFSANGQRPRDNNYMLDGVDNNETWLQTVVIFPSVDALDEFKLQTSTYSAEFGRSMGGVVNLQIKSGTQRVPRQRLRVPAQRRLRRQQLVQQPGGHARSPTSASTSSAATLGGPIIKDKTFFFADYQGMRIEPGPDLPVDRAVGQDAQRGLLGAEPADLRPAHRPALPGQHHPAEPLGSGVQERPHAALPRAEHGRHHGARAGSTINNYLINPTPRRGRTTSSTSRSTTG